MSNTRKLKQPNGGRLTRPRSQWAGRARRSTYNGKTAVAAASRLVTSQLGALRSLRPAVARQQARQGDDRG